MKRDQFPVASFYYEGRLEDGTVFDSSLRPGEPTTTLLGRHEIIPGFENALMDMKVGEKREITISPDFAYGYHQKKAVQRSKLSLIKNGHLLEEGNVIKMKTPYHVQPIEGKVLKRFNDFVEIDFNHPLAGKELYFSIELVGLE